MSAPNTLELQGTETIDAWSTLPDDEQKRILLALAAKLQTKDLATLRRIVDLANPQIARGIQYDKTYTRIANESLDVLRTLLNAYLP